MDKVKKLFKVLTYWTFLKNISCEQMCWVIVWITNFRYQFHHFEKNLLPLVHYRFYSHRTETIFTLDRKKKKEILTIVFILNLVVWYVITDHKMCSDFESSNMPSIYTEKKLNLLIHLQNSNMWLLSLLAYVLFSNT